MTDANLVIWKAVLAPGLNNYPLPKGAKLLSVAMQRGQPTLWFLCNPRETERETRMLLLTGTGHDFGAMPFHFIGTMLTEDQAFVFHVLEAIDPLKATIEAIIGRD